MRVSLTKEAALSLDELQSKIHVRVLKLLEKLTGWPKVSGVERLSGNWGGHFRVRTGDYRLVFRVEKDAILVVKIGHRKEVYDD
jgi:mRNA interferase RelE/StbE